MTLKTALIAGALSLACTGAASAAVVQSDLNLRRGPGTSYGVVTVLPAGAEVDVIGCSGAWCRVAWGSAQGYASARYLDEGPVYRAGPPVYRRPSVSFSFGFGNWRDHGWYGPRPWYGPRWYGPRGYGWRGYDPFW